MTDQEKPTKPSWDIAFEPGKIITIGCDGFSEAAGKPRCVAFIPNGGDEDIGDPIGTSVDRYREIRDQIDGAMPRLTAYLE